MNGEITLKRASLPNGETLVYREKGTGNKVLVLVHGNLSSSLYWDLLLEKFPEPEYRIIAPDLGGFGESTYQNPITSIRDFAADLQSFADALAIKDFARRAGLWAVWIPWRGRCPGQQSHNRTSCLE